jgi:hypothetical protein
MRPIKSVLVSSVLRIRIYRRVSREWRLLEPTVGLL